MEIQQVLVHQKTIIGQLHLQNMISKILEIVILKRIEEYIYTCKNQFGFKEVSSTDQCIYALKEMISMYNALGISVFLRIFS